MYADPESCKRYYKRLRAEREAQRKTNPYATRLFVPFGEWLRYAANVADWRTLQRYRLHNYYLDYRVECVRNEMLFESARNFGLDNV